MYFHFFSIDVFLKIILFPRLVCLERPVFKVWVCECVSVCVGVFELQFPLHRFDKSDSSLEDDNGGEE